MQEALKDIFGPMFEAMLQGENIFQCLLHILYAFGVVLVEDRLGQLSVWSYFFFSSCHSECVHPFLILSCYLNTLCKANKVRKF